MSLNRCAWGFAGAAAVAALVCAALVWVAVGDGPEAATLRLLAVAGAVLVGAITIAGAVAVQRIAVRPLESLNADLVARRLEDLGPHCVGVAAEVAEVAGSAAMVSRLLAGKNAYADSLRQNQDSLVALLEASPIAVAVCDSRTQTLLFANRRCGAVLGMAGDLNGVPLDEFGRAAPLSRMWPRDLPHGAEVRDRRLPVRRDDGATVWVLASFSRIAFMGEDAVIAWFYDITSQVAAEEELRRQRNMWASLHDLAVAASHATDATAAMEVALLGVCRHFSWPAAILWRAGDSEGGGGWRLAARHCIAARTAAPAVWADALDEAMLPDGTGVPGRAAAKGAAVWLDAIPGDDPRAAITADGEGPGTVVAVPVIVDGTAVAVLEFATGRHLREDGAVAAYLSHIAGQTAQAVARERLEKGLRAARFDAEQASAAKSTFLASMSHELRTPLNAILGFSETILGEYFGPLKNERYREYVQTIHGSGRHLLELINQILDLSKIEAGKLELSEEEVDLRHLAEDAAALVAPRANAGKISLCLDAPQQGPAVLGDALRLRQILLNLLSNAVKFTPAGGTVRLVVAIARDGAASVEVSDTGPGIAAEEIAAALRPFEQTGTGRAHSGEGTGLGLPLAKALTELHGGVFTLSSREGAGTTVRLALPSWRTRPRRQAG